MLFFLECEVHFGIAVRVDDYLLLLCPELFLPYSNGISARRQIADGERTIVFGNGKVRVTQNPDERMHPAVDVTFHPNHDFRLEKLARDRRISGALAVIPLAIHFSHWMDIMGYRVRVDDLEDLTRLNAEHSRSKPATTLIDRDRICRNRES